MNFKILYLCLLLPPILNLEHLTSIENTPTYSPLVFCPFYLTNIQPETSKKLIILYMSFDCKTYQNIVKVA